MSRWSYFTIYLYHSASLERIAAEERQKAKAESKKAQADAQRKKAEKTARAQQQRGQLLRSAVFAAARLGDAATVKKGVWEDEVDAAGGEVKVGCHDFVKSPPKDSQEALLHIAARNGDSELVEWLDAHSQFVISQTILVILPVLVQVLIRKNATLQTSLPSMLLCSTDTHIF